MLLPAGGTSSCSYLGGRSRSSDCSDNVHRKRLPAFNHRVDPWALLPLTARTRSWKIKMNGRRGFVNLRLLAFAATLCFGSAAYGQQKCLMADQIKTWEALGGCKAVVYDQGGGYLAFVSLSGCRFEKGKTMTIRLFSPSICPGDTIVVNGGPPDSISFIEAIRRQ